MSIFRKATLILILMLRLYKGHGNMSLETKSYLPRKNDVTTFLVYFVRLSVRAIWTKLISPAIYALCTK